MKLATGILLLVVIVGTVVLAVDRTNASSLEQATRSEIKETDDERCQKYAAQKHIDVSEVGEMIIVYKAPTDGCSDYCNGMFRNFAFAYSEPNSCCCGVGPWVPPPVEQANKLASKLSSESAKTPNSDEHECAPCAEDNDSDVTGMADCDTERELAPEVDCSEVCADSPLDCKDLEKCHCECCRHCKCKCCRHCGCGRKCGSCKCCGCKCCDKK